MFVRVHQACAAAVKTFLSPNRAKDRKHFQPSAEAFLRRMRGGRGSLDSEANSPTTGRRRREAVWSFGALAF